MKYMVEVNAKYLVAVEAETPLSAEHKMLDYNGVWGALAFDHKMLKTDTFAGAVMSCFTASEEEIKAMACGLAEAKANAMRTQLRLKELDQEIAEYERHLKEAREAQAELQREYQIRMEEYHDREETFGKQRT